MQAGVPTLLAKIALYQPRVVCFVGKQIGEVFLKEAGASSTAPSTTSSVEGPSTAVAAAADNSTSTSPDALQPSPPKKTAKARQKPARPAFTMGFQPYKVVHPPGAPVRETLVYIMPSSSARVTGYQLPDKVRTLRTLYEEVQRMKVGEGVRTDGMRVVGMVAVEEEPKLE